MQQMKKKVFFQGEHGAFSEEAAINYFRTSVKTIPCKTFEEVFQAVRKKNSHFGIIPIENSLAGSLHINYDLLLK
jgi:prephenate dehydratase